MIVKYQKKEIEKDTEQRKNSSRGKNGNFSLFSFTKSLHNNYPYLILLCLMDCEKERSNSNCERKRRRRGFWAVLSCFGGDADQKRLAVVPVETSGGESDQKSSCGDAIGGKKERKKEMNCRKSFKDQSKGNNAPTKPESIQAITIVHHVASNLQIKTEPAPLYQILDPVQTQTQTRTSHPGSPEPVNQPALREVHEESLMKNGYGPWMGLFVLTLALALMVLGGLTVGVICMCVWFSVLYMLGPGTLPEQHGTSKKKPEEIDVNSEEYKKMVVLRGFLERDKSKSMKETIGDGV